MGLGNDDVFDRPNRLEPELFAVPRKLCEQLRPAKRSRVGKNDSGFHDLLWLPDRSAAKPAVPTINLLLKRVSGSRDNFISDLFEPARKRILVESGRRNDHARDTRIRERLDRFKIGLADA